MTDALALREQPTLTEEQVALVKRTIAKGASDDELKLFVQTCNKLQLDPFARQIYLVKRWDSQLRCEVAQSQVSIDGFRLVAERTREYRGQTAPQWCGDDGVWKDVWLSNDPPAAARVGVHRQGFAEPMVRVAKYTSYVQKTKDKQTGAERPNRMWATMPEVMLAKCAEALALRAAFPHELGGVYTSEEMGQADNDREEPAQRERPFAGSASTQSQASTSGQSQSTQTRSQAATSDPEATLAQLRKDLAACSDFGVLVDFCVHAYRQLRDGKYNEQQSKTFWDAFGERCKALKFDPKDVVAAARAKGRAA